MPRLRDLTAEEERERKWELTQIRRLQARGFDEEAAKRKREYAQRYFILLTTRDAGGRFTKDEEVRDEDDD